MPPRAKKRKTAAPEPDDDSALLDPNTWPGWTDVESEPAFFNVMLRELGVNGVKITEIMALDELAHVPQPVHALIFLFRYRGNEAGQIETSCPQHIWFANQIPDHGCASIALLNIVNNIEGLDIGPHLQSFRDFTSTMEPLERGYAIEDFQFLRRVHNSFARELDILTSNLSAKLKHERALRKARSDTQKAARATKRAEATAAVQTEEPAPHGARRSKRVRNPKQTNKEDGSADEEVETEQTAEDSGFHFEAYLPVDHHLWKMDGLDAFPHDLGRFDKATGWLDMALPAIQQKMAEYGAEKVDFNLMAIVHDDLDELQRSLAEATRAEDEPARTELCDKASIMVEIQERLAERERDQRRAVLRRHDYREFLTAWIDALSEADVLDTLAMCVKSGL